jgi:hypothetical protein
MAIEYVEYAVILMFLFLSKPMRARFNGPARRRDGNYGQRS